MIRFIQTIIFVLLFLPSALWAQTAGVGFYVKITGDDGAPLEGIHLSLEGTNFKTITDSKGEAVIKEVPEGKYFVVASGVGYTTLQQSIRVSETTKPVTTHLTLYRHLYEIPSVVVIGGRDPLFTSVPGSLSHINMKEIRNTQPVNGNEVLRQSPGLNVVEEEGLGLRTNIGIRGLDPDRSRTVLMLEDGVPVALAPYGEPEMYYTPAIERMTGVEVLKGSGSILYGPQTIGGVINYQTADPPSKPEGFAKLTVGEGGFFTGMLGYGTTMGNTGVQVNYLRKQADQFGATMLRLNDLSGKIHFRLSETSAIGVKLSVYDELSNSTYIGLTQRMYEMGGNDYTTIAPDDRLDVRRYSASVSHKKKFSSKLSLETIAYGYTTTRDWMRQDFASNAFDTLGNLKPKPADWSGVTWGDTTVAGGALYMRNSTGNRNRSFEVAGIEPRLRAEFATGSLTHKFTGGIRFLYERVYEQRINGTKSNAVSGSIAEDEIRTGYGYSAFIHHQVHLTKSFSITAGTRVEYFEYERDIRRGKFTVNGTSSTRDTMVVTESNVMGVIPGAGFNLIVSKSLNLFGGVHRGFAPPRVKDAISSEGIAYELDAETSWNYELGIRTTPLRWLSAEVTGFYMDFENQIIPVSESSGGSGSGLVNGGRTTHSGVETALTINTRELSGSKYYAELHAGVGYVKSVYSADRFIGGTDAADNIRNNFTPYAPEWNATGKLSLYSPFGLSITLGGNYVSDQFSDESNTIEATADGRTGLIASHYTFDAGAKMVIQKINTVFHVCVKNLTDERYITSRRPQGIRVGLPRMVFGGVTMNF